MSVCFTYVTWSWCKLFWPFRNFVYEQFQASLPRNINMPISRAFGSAAQKHGFRDAQKELTILERKLKHVATLVHAIMQPW